MSSDLQIVYVGGACVLVDVRVYIHVYGAQGLTLGVFLYCSPPSFLSISS